jgi:excisionase family DNA binding protein
MSARPYSVPSLAAHWGCAPDTVYSLIKGGDLQAFRVGGKLLRIRAEEVERYECQTSPTASNDCADASPSSGMKTADDTDIRLERMIERRPKPRLVHSGSDGADGASSER